MSSDNKGGREPVYDNSFKVAVAREYLTSKLGYGKLAKKHGLSLTTVRYFVKWYKAHYSSDPQSSPTSVNESVAPSSGSEVEELRKQLQQANLKVAAWEMLIENARQELGVDIVKKYGTKQSGK
jgi:transposase-like protein